MANGKKLYSAYRGAGKSAASYKASLYDIENLGIEREGSAAAHQFRMQEFSKHAALAQQAVGLVSDIAGGYKAKKEAAADRATVQEGMAKKAYKGDVAWGELSDTARQAEISKFAPKQSKRSLGDILSGAERKYTFGEGNDEFTSSQITAASSLYGESKLADILGQGPTSKVEKLQESLKSEVNEQSKDAGLPVQEPEMIGDVGVDPDAGEGFDTEAYHMRGPAFTQKPGGKRLDLSKIGDFEIPSLMDNTRTVKYGGSWAKGGEFTTDGPEMILVGDNPGGKEKVKVTPIKSKGKEKLADNIGTNLKDLVSKKGSKPGSKKWMNEYISSQKINNESLRPLQGELSKHNKKLFSMAEEAGYFGEFFRGGWE